MAFSSWLMEWHHRKPGESKRRKPSKQLGHSHCSSKPLQKCPPRPHSYILPISQVLWKQVSNPSPYFACTGCIILTCALPSDSGPHSCTPGHFTCKAPNRSWPGTFKTKQAFKRHYRAKHLNDRVDCPVEGCLYVGDRGIKRADNLPAHLLNKHGISRDRPLYEN